MSTLQTCTLEKMCGALLEYYNTSILSRPDMDKSLKEACYIEAQKCADGNLARGGTLERTVLKSLIVNHEINGKPVAGYIAGPYSLSLQWSEIYKKLIYIFGEIHESKTDCDHYGKQGIDGQRLIEDYLEQLFTYSDVFIDFYNEYDGYYKTSVYKDPTHMKNLRLYKIWEKIQKCVEKSTRDLPGNNCQKARMHYIDIRIMNGVKVNNSSAFSNLHETFKSKVELEFEDNLNEFFNDEQVINLLQDLSKIEEYEYTDFFKFFEDEFNHYEIYNKQVGKSNIKDKIKDFIKEKLINIDKSIIDNIFIYITQIIKITDGYKTEHDDDIFYEFNGMTEEEYFELKEYLEMLSDSLVDVNYLIVDGYLLGRVFKTFDIDTQDPNKQRPTDEPSEPHNIIIYAGESHSNNYRRFLDKKLGFITIGCVGKDWRDFPEHRTKEDEEQENPIPANCIDMEDFPQPFFSNMDDVNWLNTNLPVKQTIDKKSQPDKLGIKKSSIGGIDKGKRYTKKGKDKLNKKKQSTDYNSSGDENETMESDYNSSGNESETMDEL